MKRILAVILSLMMVFTTLGTVTFAAGGSPNVSFTVDKTTAAVGDTITVTVSNKAMTVSSFTCGFKFDKDNLECKSVVGPISSSPSFFCLTPVTPSNPYSPVTEVKAVSTPVEANDPVKGGAVGFAHTDTDLSGVPYKESTLFTATFEVKSVGSGSFDFVLYESSSGTDNYNSDSIETKTVTISKAPISSVTASVKKPEAGKALDTSVDLGGATAYTGTVKWYVGETEAAEAIAKPNTKYTAKITLTASSGESFADSVTIPTGYTKDSSSTSSKLVLTKTFSKTDSLPAATVTDVPAAKTGLKYTGSEQELVNAGTTTDGTMQYSLDNRSWSDTIPKGKDAKTYTVYYMVKGDSSHSDYTPTSNTVSVKIDPKDISGTTIGTIANEPYTGSAITPAPEVKDGTTTLVKGTDYTVSCTNNTNAGTATLTIKGKGNYTGTKSANFTIVAADQNPTFTTPKDLVKGGAMLDLSTLVQGAKGEMTFTIAPGTTSATLSGHTLTSTGIKGEVKVSVSITAKDVNNDGENEYNAFSKSEAITVNVVDKTTDTSTMKVSQGDIIYGGSVSPTVTNKPAGTGEVSYTYEGRDDTSYSSATAPTNVGKYKVKAKCESSTTIYTAEANFAIQPKSISGMTVTLDKTSLEYNGSAQAVNVTVKDGGTTLINGTDYTVTGTTSSTNVGNYTVTVTGRGNYTGRVDRTWKITQGTPTYTVPTGLTATFGQKLADITLSAGWSWMDSTQPVGDASTTPKTFKAKFTPADTTNYKTVENIDVSVTVGKKTAPTLEDIKHNLLYTTTSTQVANVGRAGMPEDAGTLTYAKGAAPMLVPVTGSTTPVVGVMSWNVDSATGTVEYQLTAGSVGEKVRFPVVISSTNYENSTVFVEIKLINKDNVSGKITFPDGKLVYNGNSQKYEKATVSIAASGTAKWTYDYLPITGTTANLNTDNLPLTVGKYTVVATYEDDTQFGTKSATLEITPAKPTGTPTFTKITEKGKTLANANLGMGTLTPTGGTLEWVAGDTTVVEANKAYEWKYTPANPNYAPVTGTIVVYPVSTGIVIYSPCYTIKASAGANGTISPAGWCSVVENGSQTFTFTPDKGYTVAKVLVDGKSVGAVKSYTFKNVTKDHTIEVIFMKSNGNPATGVFVMP